MDVCNECKGKLLKHGNMVYCERCGLVIDEGIDLEESRKSRMYNNLDTDWSSFNNQKMILFLRNNKRW